MAEAFCQNLGRDVECASAGSAPADRVAPEAVTVMQEVGLDLSQARPKGFDRLAAGKWDYLVTMGCEVDCPFLPGARVIGWQIPDPHGKEMDEFRRVRDLIREQVRGMLLSLGLLKHQPEDNHQPLA
jgi:protein-tyrosine-phosphatase